MLLAGVCILSTNTDDGSADQVKDRDKRLEKEMDRSESNRYGSMLIFFPA
jgi:hypothetical protein